MDVVPIVLETCLELDIPVSIGSDAQHAGLSYAREHSVGRAVRLLNLEGVDEVDVANGFFGR